MSRTFRLGLFIVGTLAAFAVGVFLIGQRQFLFTSTYRLKSQFPNVAGLNDGAEVRVGGIHQGTVRQIQLPPSPDKKVTVIMDLQKQTRGIIKKDSVASIQTEGLLGNKFVEISFGSTDAETVKNGDTIDSRPPLDISDLMQKTNQILDSTKETMGNVAVTSDNLKDMSSKINQGKGTVGALINDKSVYDQLNATTAQAKAGATAFQENMEALKHNFFLRGFFRKRGYEDSNDLKKHEVAHVPEIAPTKTFSYDTNSIFSKPDSAKLKNGKPLEEAGRFLEQNNFGTAIALAYSPNLGDTEKKQELTEAQAMAVRDYLVNHFKMDDTHVKTLGLGKNSPAGAAEQPGVEIRIYSPGAVTPPPMDLAKSSH